MVPEALAHELDKLAGEGNPYAALYKFRLARAGDPEAEADQIMTEIRDLLNGVIKLFRDCGLIPQPSQEAPE